MSTSKRPWLLRSPHTMETDVRIAYVFLEPDLMGPRVHRGRALTLRSDSDTDWPFTIQGEFDDETLISLIEFIRSGPRLPILHKDQVNRELRRDAPVSGIARRDSRRVGDRV